MSPKPRKAEETGREYFDAIAARDVDRMAACWHADGQDIFYGLETLDGPDGVRAYFTALFSSFPDFAFRVLDLVADDGTAAVRWAAGGPVDRDAKFPGPPTPRARLRT